MGKVQKKKRSLADKVRKTKTSTEIKNNPFEVKINRKKFEVLGRKTKHDVGLPGVSRSKAINKVSQRESRVGYFPTRSSATSLSASNNKARAIPSSSKIMKRTNIRTLT